MSDTHRSPTDADYDGSVLVNARFLQQGHTLLLRKATSGEPGQLPLLDLLAFLNYVENSAVSTRLYYDPTLPEDTLTGIRASVDEARDRAGALVAIEQAPDIPGGIVAVSREAASRACWQFKEVAAHALDSKSEKPLPPQEAVAIRSLLLRASTDAADHDALADEAIASGIRGSKLVAGLCNPGSTDSLRTVLELLAQRPESDHGALLATCINRFRVHLLSLYAERTASAHLVGNYEWARVETFSRHVWQEFLARAADDTNLSLHATRLGARSDQLRSLAASAGNADLSLPDLMPPVGLVALMTSDSKEGPIGVLRQAREMVATRGGSSFRNEVWSVASRDPRQQEEEVRKLYDAASRYMRKSIPQVPRPDEPRRLFFDLGASLAKQALLFLGATAIAGPVVADWLVGLPSAADLGSQLWAIGKGWTATGGRRGYLNFFRRTAEQVGLVSQQQLEQRVKDVFRARLVVP